MTVRQKSRRRDRKQNKKKKVRRETKEKKRRMGKKKGFVLWEKGNTKKGEKEGAKVFFSSREQGKGEKSV